MIVTSCEVYPLHGYVSNHKEIPSSKSFVVGVKLRGYASILIVIKTSDINQSRKCVVVFITTTVNRFQFTEADGRISAEMVVSNHV